MQNQDSILLTMRGIDKHFPGVTALSKVDFTLRQGEIHALMGENGAGKSTLIKVLTGVEHADAGTILLQGKPILVRSPLHAQELGISTVYQEINLCPNLSVAENIFIGWEPKKGGRIDWRTVNERAQEILAGMGIHVNVTRLLGSCSVAIQQMVAIARALQVSARILILDEPTSSLDASEVKILFDVMRKLKQDGLGIIFITHFLDQVYEITDRITVLRNGKLVGEYETKALPRFELVSTMIGKKLENLEQLADAKVRIQAAHESLLEARQIGLSGSIAPFDLSLFSGEVVGFAGLLGSGRTEAARLLFGLEKPDSGEIKINKQTFRSTSPSQSIKNGVGFCPEDRKANGILGPLSVRENIILALQSRYGWFKFLGKKQQIEIAEPFIKVLAISTTSPDQPVQNLSGGNQQKVVLARWLATNPRILILDEPTRGIDIGSKTEIQKFVLNLAAEGVSVVFISSELDEVLRCSHRVMVLRNRQMITELDSNQLNGSTVMQVIAGE